MRTHGVVATYSAGCRCWECRGAARTYQAKRRAAERRKPHRPFHAGRPEQEDPMRWADRAVCATVPLEVFFPDTRNYDPAKAVCASCDVREDCLAYALRTRQPAGCWGGLTPDERWRLERTGGWS